MALRLDNELPVTTPRLLKPDFRQNDAGSLNLLGRGNNGGHAVDDDFSGLVHDAAIEDDVSLGRILFTHGDCYHHGVAQNNRISEIERLTAIDGAGPGKLRAEQGRDQGSAPHAM